MTDRAQPNEPVANLTIVERIALPEPLHGLQWTQIPCSGWTSVLVLGASRSLLRLDFEDGAPRVSRTTVVLPACESIGRASFSGEIVSVELDDRVRLFDLNSGEERLSAVGEACLIAAPAQDGRRLLDPVVPGGRAYLLPSGGAAEPEASQGESLGLPEMDQPAAADVFSGPDGDLHLVVGSYGHADHFVLRPGATSGAPSEAPGEGSLAVTLTHAVSGLVYDPVEVEPGGAWPFALINHGYGIAIDALDVRGGQLRAFPLRAPPTRYGYGAYRQAHPNGPGQALVERADGWFQWKVDEGVCRRVGAHDRGGDLLWVRDDTAWGLEFGEPDALVRMTLAGSPWYSQDQPPPGPIAGRTSGLMNLCFGWIAERIGRRRW